MAEISDSAVNSVPTLLLPPSNNQESPLIQESTDDFEWEGKKLNHKTGKAVLRSLKQDISERKDYALRTFQMLAFWLIFTGAIILFCALGKLTLSGNVLIALLTTSSANVIAIFIYVVKYLFNNKV